MKRKIFWAAMLPFMVVIGWNIGRIVVTWLAEVDC